MAVKQKKNGKYLVDVRDHLGKRIERTFSKLMDARAFEAKVIGDKYDRTLIRNDLRDEKHNIYEALEEFKLTKSDLRPASVKKYYFIISQIRLFFEALGINHVDEFTPDHASLFFREITKEKKDPTGNTDRMVRAKPKTINFYLNTIRSFFDQEVKKAHIVRNPFLHIKNLKVEKKKPDYYTVDELNAFFSIEMKPEHRNAFMGLLFTGMRFAELANLTWRDVDLENRFLFVRSNDAFKTKTANSERIIPILDFLMNILNEIKPVQESDYVFKTPEGKQLKERRLLAVCKKVAEKAGIKSNAYLHKFRHTYATMLVQRGTGIYAVKELLGHSSVTQTEIYAHHRSDLLHSDVSKLNNLLSR